MEWTPNLLLYLQKGFGKVVRVPYRMQQKNEADLKNRYGIISRRYYSMKKSKAKGHIWYATFCARRKENKNIFIYLLITERSRRKISQKTTEFWTYKS